MIDARRRRLRRCGPMLPFVQCVADVRPWLLMRCAASADSWRSLALALRRASVLGGRVVIHRAVVH